MGRATENYQLQKVLRLLKMANNSSDADCFEKFGEQKYVVLLIVRTILSFISCCILLCVVGLIVLFQKHRFMSQRLVLYLASFSFTFSLIQIINLDSHIASLSDTSLQYCIVIGFATQVTIWWELLTTTCIMMDIFLKAVFQIQSTEKLEKFYLLFIIITPFTFSWIPFIQSHYGPAGLYCWIRDRNLEDCSLSEFGNWLRFGMYYIPLYTLMPILIILVVISLIIVQWRNKQWMGKYSPERHLVHQMIQREIRPLLYYPFIFVIINIVPLIRRAYSAHDTTDTFFFVLTAIQIVVFRFQGVLIGLVFALDPETREKLNWVEIRAAVVSFCTKRNNFQLYPAKQGLSDSKNPYSVTDTTLLTSNTSMMYSVN